jgi:hypothetical protein
MKRVHGRVALISGAACCQARTHAVTVAKEDETTVHSDICCSMPAMLYPAATSRDPTETARRAEELEKPYGLTVAVVRAANAANGLLIQLRRLQAHR